MSIEAMKQALEAMGIIKSSCLEGRMAHAENEAAIAEYILSQAIADAEKQKPVAWREIMGKWKTHYYDYNEDGRGEPLYAAPVHANDISQERVDETAKRKHKWVGLTDEAIWLEYQHLWPFHPAEEPTLAKDIAKFARAIEAKLKEKNA